MNREAALTGERLDATSSLYAADLVRHRAAYRFAASRAAGRRVLDLGCGTGYGAAELAESGAWVVALDRAQPANSAKQSDVRFVRADLGAVPLAAGSFDLIVSFQVIEHLDDPRPYLDAIARLLRPGGTALLSTPNLAQSDRENPFHVHEYESRELEMLLSRHFGRVEMLGVGAEGDAWIYHEARLRNIRRITRLDPLGLRRRLPRPLVEWIFARLSVVVRFAIGSGRPPPAPDPADYPIRPADSRCLDLLAVCRNVEMSESE